MGRGRQSSTFRGGRTDDRPDGGDSIGRKPSLAGVFAHHLFIRCDVDAVDLVVGDETFQPLHLWTKLLENAAGLLRDGLEFRLGQFAGVRNLPLDYIFRHGTLLRLRFWLLQPRTRILALLEVPHTPQVLILRTPGIGVARFLLRSITFAVESTSRELPHRTAALYPSGHA